MAKDSSGGPGAPDPKVLADAIQDTREELAETLDAIADKVSPKRVATRTRKQVGEAVKAGADDAVESVQHTAAVAVDAVRSGVTQARDTVTGAGAAVTSAEQTGSVRYPPPPYAAPAPSRLPVLAGAGAAALVLLLALRRRRR